MRRKSVVSLCIFLALLCFVGWKVYKFQLGYALWDAARRGDAPAVQSLLRRGASPDSSWQGLSALRAATHDGHTEAARLLLDAGASTKGALRQAAWRERTDILKLILARGESVKTKEGSGALYVAAATGDAEIVKILLAHGANPNARNLTPYFDGNSRTETWSALQVAQVNKNREVVRLLKAAGARD